MPEKVLVFSRFPKTLMQRISLDFNAPYPKSIVVKPELIVRASTAPPRKLD